MAPDGPCEGLHLYLAGKQVPAIVPPPPGTAMPSVPKPESSLAACDTKGQKGAGVTLKPAPQLLGFHLHWADGCGLSLERKGWEISRDHGWGQMAMRPGCCWLQAVPACIFGSGLRGRQWSCTQLSLRAARPGILLCELQAQSGDTLVLWLLPPVSQ